MIDKLKEYLFKIVAPLAFIAGFIYYLFTQKTRLERELEVGKIEKEQAEYEAKQKELKNDADNAVARYKRVADGYELEHPSDKLPGSNSGSGSGDPGKTD